ncbi:regulatory protein GemA [Citrobacter portucalensis]|uniref:gp16 family protein n=1 Tax=Citrobacter portucalensis TaxID=1639133 RepID=UPI00226B452F|nr:regulatory protein GemA [Citrobacter portucalensis]MCX9038958.1 regulatory protein GemA [Citrobacter portucalensis]
MSKNKLIQLIHIAKSQLAIDDDTYRQMLLSTSGKLSTRQCTIPQLQTVLDVLKARGFSVKPVKKAGSVKPDSAPQSKKIRALWLSLADAGLVRDRSEGALARWVKRETDVEALQWLNSEQASQCIEKLKQWLSRAPKENHHA